MARQSGTENGRSTHCQSKECTTKLNDINYFNCPKCKMHLCMKHRFDDLHNCKPIKETEKYEKIRKKAFGFNWSSKPKKDVKKKD
jgi:predicted nucleic acid binding AN1-type Zn finger protein